MFLFINGAASVLLNAINQEKTVTKIYIIAALFNVCLNLILIPVYSYDGAAIATVISEILITILTLYFMSKTNYKPDLSLLKSVIKLVICGIILIIILYNIKVSLYLAIPIGLAVYLLSLFLTKSIDEQDKYIIKELF